MDDGSIYGIILRSHEKTKCLKTNTLEEGSLFVSIHNVNIEAFQRSATLFGIGMFLANGYELSTWRIPGMNPVILLFIFT